MSEYQERKEETLSSYIGDWADNTYIHGIPSVKRSKSKWRKLIWLLLFLSATGALVQQCVDLIIDFGSYPVKMKLEYQHERHMVYPAITICNLNIIRKSSLPLIIDPEMRALLGSSVGENDSEDHTDVNKRHHLRKAFLKLWSTLDDDLKRNVSHQLKDMLLNCKWQGEHCSHTNFTSFINNHHGNCYTFNSGWDGSSHLRTDKAGSLEGLSLEFFVQQEEYMRELTEAAGIKVIIHDQNKMIFPEDEGMYISPGFLTSIAVRKACHKTCYARHVIKDCSCADYNYPLFPHLEAFYGILPHTHTNSSHLPPCDTPDHEECWDQVRHQYKMGTLDCNCPIDCNEVVFSTEISSAKWPSKAYMSLYHDALARRHPRVQDAIHGHNGSEGAPGDDLLKLEVYYSALNYELISQEAAYQITSLLSDIGGQLGFWIGLSIIGCVEVIELLVDLAILACLGVFGCGRSRTGGKTSPVMPYTTGGDSSKDADIKAKLGYRGTTIVHK